MDISFKDVASPLFSALTASFITHWLTLRRNRADLLLKERAQAFCEIHRKLVEILRYCEARACEEKGAEFGPTTEELCQNDKKSILEHYHELRGLQAMHFIYFPKPVSKQFKVLDQMIQLMCGHDLRCAHDEHAPASKTGDYYESLGSMVRTTVECLYNHSPLR